MQSITRRGDRGGNVRGGREAAGKAQGKRKKKGGENAIYCSDSRRQRASPKRPQGQSQQCGPVTGKRGNHRGVRYVLLYEERVESTEWWMSTHKSRAIYHGDPFALPPAVLSAPLFPFFALEHLTLPPRPFFKLCCAWCSVQPAVTMGGGGDGTVEKWHKPSLSAAAPGSQTWGSNSCPHRCGVGAG